MQNIIQLADSALADGEQVMLATIVRLDGSGYGRPGARLLMTESGERTGYISGGCLEKDLCRRAWTATENGPKLIAFDTRGNSVEASGYNTGCDGVVYVLCRRIHNQDDVVLAAMTAPYTTGLSTRIVTVYRSESIQIVVGDCLARIGNESTQLRLIDGHECSGPLHFALSAMNLPNLTSNKSIQFQDSEGRFVEAFVETIHPPKELMIFGAGDDAIPLYQSATQLGWNVTVVGRRAELADPRRFPKAEVYCGSIEQILPRLSLRQSTQVVMMTHDFEQDVKTLPKLLDAEVGRIGILGPKRRLGKLVQRIMDSGRIITPAEAERIKAPVGLDIGAISPEEIAISIIAELIALDRDRQGGFLHDRRQPLNQPHHVEDLTEPEPANSAIVSPHELAVEFCCEAGT